MPKIEKSPFDALIDELAAMRTQREADARLARHAAEALRNRHSRRVLISRLTKENRRMAKAAPRPAPAPAKAPDWEGIASRQAQIEIGLQQTAAQHQQNAIRDRLAGLGAEAKAGRLDVHSAALFDVLRGRAAAMGLQP